MLAGAAAAGNLHHVMIGGFHHRVAGRHGHGRCQFRNDQTADQRSDENDCAHFDSLHVASRRCRANFSGGESFANTNGRSVDAAVALQEQRKRLTTA